MKTTLHLSMLLGAWLLGTSFTHAVTYLWGGSTGNWNDNAKWDGGTGPSQTGNAADTVEFANNATSNYTATYVGQVAPTLATAFSLDKLILGGGATAATGNNLINRNEDVSHNLRFVGNAGGIVNSTSNGVGYEVQMAVVVAPPVSAGFATLNLSGNGTSLVSLSRGVLPDVSVFPLYNVNMVKTGTSTFEINGTATQTTTTIQEGAIQFGAGAQVSAGLINLGHTSGTADARIILHNGDALANTGDITVVNSAGGGTRTLQSTATGFGQNVGVAGDIAINHSLGLRIDSGTNDATFNLSGAISGSGDLIVAGTGKVFSSGSMTGFTGDIVVESGSYADVGSLFGTGSTAAVTVGNGGSDASMNFANTGATYAQPITIGAGAGARDFRATENGTLTGDLSFNNGADLTVTAGKAFVIQGGLTGAIGSGNSFEINAGNGGSVELAGNNSGLTGILEFGVGASADSNSQLIFSNTAAFAGTIDLKVGKGKVVLDALGAVTSCSIHFNTMPALTPKPELEAKKSVTLGGSIFYDRDTRMRIGELTDELNLTGNISGVGGMEKQGAGTLTLSNNTPSSLAYNGPTTVSEGTLKVNRDISNSNVTVASGATLSGSGSVGAVGGSGTLSPGNSPGIFTTTQIDPTGGLDFAFEFTRSNASGGTDFGSPTNPFNDVSRITGGTPFTAALTGANKLDIYLNMNTLTNGSIFDAGFYTDASADFYSFISGADRHYFLKDAGGSTVFGGVNYSALNLSQWTADLRTVALTANFGAGNVNGRSMQVEFTSSVPEPSRTLLALVGVALVCLRRRRPRH